MSEMLHPLTFPTDWPVLYNGSYMYRCENSNNINYILG